MILFHELLLLLVESLQFLVSLFIDVLNVGLLLQRDVAALPNLFYLLLVQSVLLLYRLNSLFLILSGGFLFGLLCLKLLYLLLPHS